MMKRIKLDIKKFSKNFHKVQSWTGVKMYREK